MHWDGRAPKNISLDATNRALHPRWFECRMVRCAAWSVLWIVTFGVAVGIFQ